jgi:two-component system LytT family sensor kinase
VGATEPIAARDLFLVEEAIPRSGRPETRHEAVAKCAMTLIMWGSSYALITLGALLAHNPGPWLSAGVRALMALLGILLCYGLHRLLRRLSYRSFRTRAIVAGVIAPFVAEGYAWVNYFAFAYAHGRVARFHIVNWNDAASTILLWTWFFIAWTGLYLAIEYNFDARHESQRSAELRSMAQAAKLRALSNQISPHFLFNSLNSIDGRSAEAERTLARLAEFFRTTLSIDPMIDVTVEREFELHRRYLAIEQVRYPDLVVDVVLPEDLRSAIVPALILQPLVENAIKHGVATSPPPTHIIVAAMRDGDLLALSVVDTGKPEVERQAPLSEGVGTANVRQRLAEYFGDSQSLVLTPGLGRFEARITMPLRFGS